MLITFIQISFRACRPVQTDKSPNSLTFSTSKNVLNKRDLFDALMIKLVFIYFFQKSMTKF